MSDASADTVDIIIKKLQLGGTCKYCNLNGANLSGVNLHGAKLFGADLSGADLRYTDISESGISNEYLIELEDRTRIYKLDTGVIFCNTITPRGYHNSGCDYSDKARKRELKKNSLAIDFIGLIFQNLTS